MKTVLKKNFKKDKYILAVASTWYLFFCVSLSYVGVNPFAISSILLNAALYGACAAIFIFFRNFPMFVKERPASPIRAIIQRDFSKERKIQLFDGTPVLIITIIFMACFSTIKSAIPLFNEYKWDQYFIRLDYAIHGQNPWETIQPFVGYPIISSILSIFYHGWIALIYVGGIYYAVFEKDRGLRQQYLVTYFSSWAICGVILAIIFSSVGPCFMEPIFGDKTFNPLMSYLREANEVFPVLTVGVQNMLLLGHQYGENGLGRGITAMPSMHVSLAFMFFLAVRKKSSYAGFFSGLFLIIIMVGSVHLGYHYAVDGYASIIVTALIWKIAGWLPTPAQEERAPSISPT